MVDINGYFTLPCADRLQVYAHVILSTLQLIIIILIHIFRVNCGSYWYWEPQYPKQ